MDNIIYLRDLKKFDPILRKGDSVRLCYNEEISIEDFGFGSDICDIDLNGLVGIVVKVEKILPDISEAPGQAEIISVAIPFEEGWEIFEGIHRDNIRRVLSKEFDAVRIKI